jgi:hypothetical protein
LLDTPNRVRCTPSPSSRWIVKEVLIGDVEMPTTIGIEIQARHLFFLIVYITH